MMATIQLFPAGQYKNVYIFTNNDGVMFKVITLVLNYSEDKVEF